MEDNSFVEPTKMCMSVGLLLKEFERLGVKENDVVVVEIHEGERSEDLYPFYVDVIYEIEDMDGNYFNEVRICI